ncbi:hypothetical protein FRC00_014117, partial [Tulasnella sp. 408]
METEEGHPTSLLSWPWSYPGSYPEIPSGKFETSAKLRAKLEQLAPWQIDPSSIKFPKEATEVHGSCGTVSRALLAVPFNDHGKKEKSARTKREAVGSNGRTGKSNLRASESDGIINVIMEKGIRRLPMMGLMRALLSLAMDLLGRWRTRFPIFSNKVDKTVAVKKMRISDDIARTLQ